MQIAWVLRVISDASAVDYDKFERISAGWFSQRPTYYMAKYTVRAIIGADILFEVLCNRKNLSKDKSIHLEWAKGALISGPIGKS